MPILARGAVAALLLLPLSAQAATDFVLAGPITHVRDGDTVVVAGTPVRLKGIAAPELHEKGGKEAKATLDPLLGREVVCHPTGETSHDRLVGWCSLVGDDLGALQIKAGNARRCAAFDSGQRYQDTPGSTLPLPQYCVPKG